MNLCFPMSSSRSRFAKLGGAFLTAALLVGLAGSISCDPGEGVTYENRTDHAVSVFEGNDLEAKLSPGQRRTFSFIVYEGSRHFVAKDDAGNVVFQADYTWDDLRRLHWRIIIGA